MGANITEVDTFTAAVPSVADGDAASGTIFTAPLQALANRTKYLKGIFDGGVSKIRTVANNAALIALTGMVTGDVVLQTDIYVLYVYDSASSATAHNGIIVQPTVGGGRWFADFSSITVRDANGDARLTLNPPKAVVAEDYQSTVAGSSLNFTVSALPFGPTVTMSLKAGDHVHLDAFTNFYTGGHNAGTYTVSLQETHSAVTTILTESSRDCALSTASLVQPHIHPMLRYTVPSNDSYAFRMVAQITSGSNTTPSVLSPWQLRAVAIRP